VKDLVPPFVAHGDLSQTAREGTAKSGNKTQEAVKEEEEDKEGHEGDLGSSWAYPVHSSG
jgi:hypothetical protein